ncbi:ABC transporter permease [Enterococcus lemanii]|jgi:putative aldouronate transport system permease protein|uniref:ABC transporter permease n=1 Tax=Enterococcus lemanii TaxID=1159752 RepID=A0ABV9N0B1_9ENTE|nr:sugar ABC transporter permease [Enterococcus lemanii]MBM7708256.1 putative aldouronate transport system permease protein [Enterococcus lemanii]
MNQARGKLIMNKKIKQSTSSSSRSKWENTKIHIINNKWLYIMTLPGLLYFLIFKYAPMYGVIIAFKDYVPFLGIHGSKWVGLQNFHDFFINPDFMRIMGNTLILSFLSIVISFPAPIILAILLNELSKAIYKRVIQTMVYVPHFLSWAIVVSITAILFSVNGGIITEIVRMLTGREINFLSDPNWFRPMIILQGIWKEIGWGTIIFLAALAGVDQEQYEAAIMDGAGRFRRVWHITLPAIRSTIVIMLILKVGSILTSGFDQIYLMTNALNRSVADVFDTYVYMMGITQGAYSYSTAVGLFKSVVGIILVLSTNKLAKAFGESGFY